MNTKEKLAIINIGGEIDESKESGSWVGNKIRKGEKLGNVIKDMNGMFRRLTVKFEDNTEETIILNNVGKDPESCHQYEYKSVMGNKTNWYRF